MTKEDFKNKYHGKSLMINVLMQEASVHQIQNKIKEICYIMGLKAYLFASSEKLFPKYLIVDAKQPPFDHSIAKDLETVSEEVFLYDFDNYIKEEQEIMTTKVISILSEMKIGNVIIERIEFGQTLEKLAEGGFIQAYTSNEASLWWNLRGDRLLLVRGQGVFSLTDKSE